MHTKTVSTQDLLDYLPNYGISQIAEEYVRTTLLSEPLREVGENARNSVAGAFSSPSQGITIQYESHTAELAWLFRWELDPDVLGFRDQPPMINIRKADKNGVTRNSTYTPDYLLFRKNEVVVVEVKTAKEVIKLSKKFPEQWQQPDCWHYIPAEEAFLEKGLVHTVCCLEGGAAVETNNFKTLVRACSASAKVNPQTADALIGALEDAAWLSITALIKLVPESSYADVYQLVAHQRLFVNLKTQILTDPDSCFVASNAEFLEIREDTDWAAPQIVAQVKTQCVPGAKELLNALARLERVNSGEQSRHCRRLKRRIAEGAELGKSPLQALVMPRKGNAREKLPPVVRDFTNSHIRSIYMTPKRPSLHAAWANYRLGAKAKHPEFPPVVIKTYRRLLAEIDPELVARSRGGKRAGNAASDPTSVLDRALIATRPFERVSIDHTKLKIRAIVVESGGSTYSKKPWMSALIDEATGYWLSFSLSFRDPSKRLLSMLYRSCAREYGRLPEHVHSDRGSDLRSVYYRQLLAHYGISVDWSPAGHSRFNALVERLNLQLKDQWISRRAGNTVDYLETRKYSKGYRPQDQAALSLQDLYSEIEVYRQLYNQTVLGTEAVPPSQKFKQGLQSFEFSGVPVVIDEDFLMITAYDVPKDYKIAGNGEVVYNCLHYYHPDLRLSQSKQSRAEIRIDPEDPYRIYCRVNDRWVTALNSGHTKFSSKSTVARLAEAIRVAEGRPLRDLAKQDANDEKAAALAEFDVGYEQRIIEDKVEQALYSSPVDNDSGRLSSDLFGRLKLKTLRDLESDEL